jgi:large subunit ribosomal protein L20
LGVPYSKLINALNAKEIILDRKILSDLAVNDPNVFEKVVNSAIN